MEVKTNVISILDFLLKNTLKTVKNYVTYKASIIK